MNMLACNVRSSAVYSVLLIYMAVSAGPTPAHADKQSRVLKKNGQPVRVAIYSGKGSYFRSIKAATRMFLWMGAEPQRIIPLDLFPGSARGPIAELAPWPGFKLCRINLSQTPHAITKGEPNSMMSLYYGAPWFDVPPGFKADILAYYDINNKPAMLAYKFGQGRVFLTGVHTEFEEGSDRDNVLWDNTMHDPESEWPLMRNAVRWLAGHEASEGSD